MADRVVAIGLLILSFVAYWITTTWIPPILPGDPGAAFFPRISLVVICCFAVLLLIQSAPGSGAREHRDDAAESSGGAPGSARLAPFMLTLVLSGALVAGIATVGFEPSAFAFLFGVLGWRTGRWLWAFVTSAIAVPTIYFLFVIVLKVRLPLLFLPPYLDLF